MDTQPDTFAVPPIETLLGELVTTLAYAAHAYLNPEGAGTPDLGSASTAIDAAGQLFDRISPTLDPGQRSSLAAMLASARMDHVKKRG